MSGAPGLVQPLQVGAICTLFGGKAALVTKIAGRVEEPASGDLAAPPRALSIVAMEVKVTPVPLADRVAGRRLVYEKIPILLEPKS
jgi:hypothetical protein